MPRMVQTTAEGQAESTTIVPRMTGFVTKKCMINHTTSGATTRRMKLSAYSLGWTKASLSDTEPSDRPMHIIESGTVAAATVSTVSSISIGMGILNTKMMTAMSVAIMGVFIASLSLNFSLCPSSRRNMTPTEYKSRLNGIFDSDAKNTALSP